MGIRCLAAGKFSTRMYSKFAQGQAMRMLQSALCGPVMPAVESFSLAVTITLQVPRDLAKVAIESGYYHLKASNLTAQVSRAVSQLPGRHCAVCALKAAAAAGHASASQRHRITVWLRPVVLVPLSSTTHSNMDRS
jgi:hypothetical protein